MCFCFGVPFSRLVAVAAIPLAVQIANSYLKISCNCFPCLPYKLMQQMLVFVLTHVGVGVLLFFPNGFSINFWFVLEKPGAIFSVCGE